MPRPAPSTTRVIELLSLLGSRPSEFLTLAEIARLLDMNKATVYSILATLTERGHLVRQADDRGYGIGPALVAAARSAIAGASDIIAIARPEMEALSDLTEGQSAAAVVVGGDTVVIAVTGRAGGGLAVHPGRRNRVIAPIATIFAAWGSDAIVETWLSGGTLSEYEKAHHEALLETVRERGFSVGSVAEDRERIEATVQNLLAGVSDETTEKTLGELLTRLAREENELFEIVNDRRYNIRQISAPVFDARGRVALGLYITSPPPLLGHEIRNHAYALTSAANRVTREIGGRPPKSAPRLAKLTDEAT